jgi:acyl-CoA thioester hydrolase
MRFSVSEYVRWEDIDAAGIINYQAYLRFFGLAEVELFRHCGLSYRTLFDELNIWLPRVHVECDFFHPVTLDELLVVDAYFGKIGTSSIHLNFEVRRKQKPDEVVATGKYVLVIVKRGEFKPSPVPAFVREKIAAYVE